MPNAPTTEFFNKSENKVFRPGQSFLLSLLKISWGFFPTRWKRQGAWYSWSVKSSFLPSWLLILNNSTQLCVDKYTGKIFLASGMSIFSWESYLSRENTCILLQFYTWNHHLLQLTLPVEPDFAKFQTVGNICVNRGGFSSHNPACIGIYTLWMEFAELGIMHKKS